MWQTTLLMPRKGLDVCFWKYTQEAGAGTTPNGNLLKENLPNGEIKVVSFLLSWSSGISENPELAYNLENTLASWSSPSVCSTVRIAIPAGRDGRVS